MNWDAIGSVGTAIGSIAVLVTLIYLSRQIRESNLLAKSTMSQAVAQGFAATNELIIANPEVAALLARLKTHDVELSEAEKIQAQQIALRYLNVYIHGQEAYDHGHIKRENLLGLKDSLRFLLGTFPALEPHFRAALKSLPSLSGYEVFDYFEGTL